MFFDDICEGIFNSCHLKSFNNSSTYIWFHQSLTQWPVWEEEGESNISQINWQFV